METLTKAPQSTQESDSSYNESNQTDKPTTETADGDFSNQSIPENTQKIDVNIQDNKENNPLSNTAENSSTAKVNITEHAVQTPETKTTTPPNPEVETTENTAQSELDITLGEARDLAAENPARQQELTNTTSRQSRERAAMQQEQTVQKLGLLDKIKIRAKYLFMRPTSIFRLAGYTALAGGVGTIYALCKNYRDATNEIKNIEERMNTTPEPEEPSQAPSADTQRPSQIVSRPNQSSAETPGEQQEDSDTDPEAAAAEAAGDGPQAKKAKKSKAVEEEGKTPFVETKINLKNINDWRHAAIDQGFGSHLKEVENLFKDPKKHKELEGIITEFHTIIPDDQKQQRELLAFGKFCKINIAEKPAEPEAEPTEELKPKEEKAEEAPQETPEPERGYNYDDDD